MNLTFLITLSQAIFNTPSSDIYFLSLCGIAAIFMLVWFYLILKDFTLFSSWTVFLISLGLVVILSMTGIMAKIIMLLYSWNPFIALIIIVLFFTSSYFLEHLIIWKIRKTKRLRKIMEEEIAKEELRKFHELIKKKK